MVKENNPHIHRDLSWLNFNERVLQEAANPHVPLLERIKFLGIFSNNQDEFFRVRVASNRRLLYVRKGDFDKGIKKEEIKQTLDDIQQQVILLQKKFDTVFFQLLDELKKQKIFWVNEKKLSIAQQQQTKRYFKDEILSTLFPLILEEKKPFPYLKDSGIYLAVKMIRTVDNEVKYAIVEIPSKIKGRFYLLPEQDGNRFIIFLDDVIRINLRTLFSSFDYDQFEAFTVKVTRDAELDFDLDISDNMYDKIKKAIKQRRIGNLVRFVYDKEMPKDLLSFLERKLKLNKDRLLPGQRYHNFKDLMSFPKPAGIENLLYPPMKQIPLPELDSAKNLFSRIAHKDYLLNHPYQSFDYVVRFLREAALDPNVTAIKITLYRVAEHSNVVNALINAVRNGKKVFVMMELKARFDEESNIYWSGKLKEAGAEVFFGYDKVKIHAKLCLVYRKEGFAIKKYAHIGTGNYNGQTAKFYCDHGLLTANTKLTNEITHVFDLIQNFYSVKPTFNHLLVAPLNLKSAFIQKIDREIMFAQKEKKAWIKFKMNSLVDKDIIKKLYEASHNGVEIKLIIRGVCCLVPDKKGLSEHIKAISIVDKFLEHSRYYMFNNNEKNEIFFGSADMMTRNLEHRIEVLTPIYDEAVKKDFLAQFDLQWSDNVKARIIDENQQNEFKPTSIPRIRSQDELLSLLEAAYLPL